MWRYRWYWKPGWWCPRHPWPPAWARWFMQHEPYYDPASEVKYLETLKKELEAELAEISKRIEELKRSLEEKEKK